MRQKNVRMLFYEGTKQSGYIQPRKLAQYDIGEFDLRPQLLHLLMDWIGLT